jgi:hypothetical protein
MMSDTSYHGPVFKLKQDYPTSMPTGTLPAFFQTDFRKDWRKYMLEVQQYCFDGNTAVDFRVEYNHKHDWFHMPWQHYGSSGREGIHGLTKEAGVKSYQLAPTQSIDSSGAWAVGFYNDVASYTIGQVWKDHYKPDLSPMMGNNAGFKNGSILFKILFVSLPEKYAVKQVPSLENGLWWDAYASSNFKTTVRKKIKVALIQMDIMVRDDRAPNGWIFGTFQYNGSTNHANKWENLIPVGLMWGQDPENSMGPQNRKGPYPNTIINTKLKETIINPDTKELPATHLGWNGRLNGPVDNPMSSCYSCHATAEYTQGSPMNPTFDADTLKNDPPGSVGWMRWFQNNKCGTPFDAGHVSTDFSLQLAAALQNFDQWKIAQSGLFAADYKKKLLKSTNPAFQKNKIFPIRRSSVL